MAGKKRSGLVNDRRAYGCGCYTPTPTPTPNPCGVINIGSIATNDGGNTYTLNGNYTITACQILNIPVGTTLQISGGKTLTNKGIIDVSGTFNILVDNYIHNKAGSGTINNSGTLNNSGYIYNTGDGGTINNSGTINNNSDGQIYNEAGVSTINNIGTFKNSGRIYNSEGTINNNSGGFIYIYGGGGALYNSDTFNNNTGGTFSLSNGGACGAGSFGGLGTFIDNGSTNTNCPP